jgi:hypothetical protein
VLLGDVDGDAHAQAGLDALHEAIDFDGAIGSDAGGEAGTYPEGVGGFDEHAVGTDITSASAENGGTPFDLKIGAVVIPRSPAALRPPWMVSTAHDVLIRPSCTRSDQVAEASPTRWGEAYAKGLDGGISVSHLGSVPTTSEKAIT